MMNHADRWVICDTCTNEGPHAGSSALARQAARDAGWVVNNRRDSCPDCEAN